MSEWGEWKLDGVCSEKCGGGIQSLIKYDGCGQSIVNNTRCNTDPCPGNVNCHPHLQMQGVGQQLKYTHCTIFE